MSVVVPLHASSIDRTRSLAVTTIVAWAHKDLPAGTSIVLANGLAFELGLRLQADYRLSEISDEPGVRVRPAAPLGVALPDGTPVDDWVALRASTGDATLLSGYRASTIAARLRAIGPTTWIESEVTGANQTSPIMGVLKDAPGVTVGARWTWPYGSGHLETIAFEIDPAKLVIPDRVVVTTQALARIVQGLEAAGPAARTAAAALLLRVQVADTDPAAPALLERLRKVAGAP